MTNGGIQKVNVDLLESFCDTFFDERNKFINSQLYNFNSSYLNSCGDSSVSRLNRILSRRYNRIEKSYNAIYDFWKEYNNCIKSLENSLSNDVRTAVYDSATNNYVQSHLQELEVFENSIMGLTNSSIAGVNAFNFNNMVVEPNVDVADDSSKTNANYSNAATNEINSNVSMSDSILGKYSFLFSPKDLYEFINKKVNELIENPEPLYETCKVVLTVLSVCAALNKTEEVQKQEEEELYILDIDGYAREQLRLQGVSYFDDDYDLKKEQLIRELETKYTIEKGYAPDYSWLKNAWDAGWKGAEKFGKAALKNGLALAETTASGVETCGQFCAWGFLEAATFIHPDSNSKLYKDLDNFITGDGTKKIFNQFYEDTALGNYISDNIEGLDETRKAYRQAKSDAGEIFVRSCSTVSVGAMSIVEGGGKALEGISDTSAIASAYVYDWGARAYGFFTGKDVSKSIEENWKYTREYVQTEFFNDLFTDFYEFTGVDESAYFYEQVRSVSSGIGYFGMDIALSTATGGVFKGVQLAGPAAKIVPKIFSPAGFTFLSGLGKNTEKAWNDGAGTYNGTIYGTAMALWEAGEMALGQRINQWKPFGGVSKEIVQQGDNLVEVIITNPTVKQQLLNTGSHILADGVDASSASFIQPLMDLIYADDKNGIDEVAKAKYDKNWSELTIKEKYCALFDVEGGWTGVITNGVIGSGLSGLTEIGDIRKAFKGVPDVETRVIGKVDRKPTVEITEKLPNIDDVTPKLSDIAEITERLPDIDDVTPDLYSANSNNIDMSKIYQDSIDNLLGPEKYERVLQAINDNAVDGIPLPDDAIIYLRNDLPYLMHERFYGKITDSFQIQQIDNLERLILNGEIEVDQTTYLRVSEMYAQCRIAEFNTRNNNIFERFSSMFTDKANQGSIQKNMFETIEFDRVQFEKIFDKYYESGDYKEQLYLVITNGEYRAARKALKREGYNDKFIKEIDAYINKTIMNSSSARKKYMCDIIEIYFPKMSQKEKIKFLNGINTGGVCSYSTTMDLIYSVFNGNETLFKQVFGFDMYTIKNGKRVLNDDFLLTDMYCWFNKHNKKVNKKGLFGWENVGDDSKQITIFDQNIKHINEYLQSKGVVCNIEVEPLLRNYCTNRKLNDGELAYVIETIKQRLDNNEGVFFQYDNLQGNISMHSIDNVVSTKTWDEGGGHSVLIMGVDKYNNLIVSSWSKLYVIPYEQLKNITFNIDFIKLK